MFIEKTSLIIPTKDRPHKIFRILNYLSQGHSQSYLCLRQPKLKPKVI